MLRNNRDNLTQAKINELAKNIIWTMTQSEPEKRITMEEARAAPYFQDASAHILLLNAVNEAIIELNKSPEGKKVTDKLNKTFFALFQVRWQEQDWPFVIAEVLKGSKYSDSLVSFLRYCRNLIAHNGQYKTILEAKFGKAPNPEELLKMILEKVQRAIIHLYWFAKRLLPQLSSYTDNFPEQCAEAYENLMEFLQFSIPEEMEELQQRVCPSLSAKDQEAANPTKTAKVSSSMEDHSALIDAFMETSHKKIQTIINETDIDFKELKQDVQQWEKQKKNLERAIEEMKMSKKTDVQEKMDAKMAELEEVEKRLQVKWFLDYREAIRDKNVFQQGHGKF